MQRAVTLDHFVLRVSDLESAAGFYVRVLGAERLELSHGRLGLRFGQAQINLHDATSTPEPLPVRVPEPGGGDLCFRWRGSADEACAHLHRHGIDPILGPVERTGAQGPGQSVYFRDPDGNLLELIAY
jgi:catechol 2,3-dioxygenase-like lactoylglutathione lyase family enzyme